MSPPSQNGFLVRRVSVVASPREQHSPDFTEAGPQRRSPPQRRSAGLFGIRVATQIQTRASQRRAGSQGGAQSDQRERSPRDEQYLDPATELAAGSMPEPRETSRPAFTWAQKTIRSEGPKKSPKRRAAGRGGVSPAALPSRAKTRFSSIAATTFESRHRSREARRRQTEDGHVSSSSVNPVPLAL